MPLLAVIIPLLMLGVVLALGRYEEFLLPTKKADPSEDAVADPLRATVPMQVLPVSEPVVPGSARAGTSVPAGPSGRRARRTPPRSRPAAPGPSAPSGGLRRAEAGSGRARRTV